MGSCSIKIASLLVASGCALACFSAKAVHMDDTLFLASARQIQMDPSHPYGFEINWFGHLSSMWRATQNPPLLSYGLAGLQAIGLNSERTLHLTFLVFSLASVVFSFPIAQRYCRYPLWVSATLWTAPVFFISATNLMADLPLLSFMLGAVACWLFALESGHRGWWIAASVWVMLAVLTKYFGATLFILLPLLSWSRGRSVSRHFVVLIPAIFALSAWNLYSFIQTGSVHIFGAAEYASAAMSLSARIRNLGITLAFMGGSFWFPVILFPFLVKRIDRKAWMGLILALLILGVLLWKNFVLKATCPHIVMLQWFGMALAGGSVLMAFFRREEEKKFSRDEIFLFVWMGWALLFTAFCNWTVSARALLPGLLPALILVSRQMEAEPLMEKMRFLVPMTGLLISLPLAWTDSRYASSARETAQEMKRFREKERARIRFSGHWGLQYYMEAARFEPLDYAALKVAQGTDLILFPVMNNTNAGPIGTHRKVIWRKRVENPIGVTCHSLKDQAGFYSSQFGILPFGLSLHATELYLLMSGRSQDQLQ